MIVRSLCNTCFQPYELLIEASDVDLVKQVADESGLLCPCPRLCGGSINLAGEPSIEEMSKDRRLRDPLPLTGKQLYKAVLGAGLPDEIPSSPELVEGLLLSKRVVGVDIGGEDVTVYIRSIRLENGTVIHLSSGQFGAQVQKVTKEQTHGQ